MTITILENQIDVVPERDPYVNLDGVHSRTYLKLDPRDRTVRVTQEYQDNSTLMVEYHDLVLSWCVNSHPRKEEMIKWIRDFEGDLSAICDGFDVIWDGHNMVGRYTDDARGYIDAIRYWLDNDAAPDNYYEFWTVDSWLDGWRDDIDANMTDAQLSDLADQWSGTGEIVVDGDILQFVTRVRDIKREELETEE